MKNMKHDISAMTGMSAEETAKIISYVTGKDKVLEWGSGGSTLYLPQLVNHYVSIEHDKYWYDKVNADITDNVEFHHVPVHNIKFDEELDASAAALLMKAGDAFEVNGRTHWPTRGGFDWHCGMDYIKKPLELSHSEYDVILVDGRCRVFCAYTAGQLLKEDGYLMIHDFIPRQYYHGVLNFYDIIEHTGTLAVLKKNKKDIDKEALIKLSDQLYADWAAIYKK